MPAWSGLWNGVYNTDYAFTDARIAPFERIINKMVRSMGHEGFVELIDTVVGASAGSAALKTHSQLKAKEDGPSEGYGYGGKRTIETVTVINRNSTSADVTAIKNMLGVSRYDLTRVVDRGGSTPVGNVYSFV